jgi:hypothetical protein
VKGAKAVTEAYTSPLQTLLGEFKNINPEITNVFIFKKAGEVLAHNENTSEEQTKNFNRAFNSLNEQAQILGGVENLTIQGADKHLNIAAINNLYLVTVSSKAADPKAVESLTHVIVPTVVDLIDKITPDLAEAQLPQTSKTDEKQNLKTNTIEETNSNPKIIENPSKTELPQSFSSEPLLSKPPTNQFMVEKIGGFLVPSDVVGIDSDVISSWSGIYGHKEIKMVNVETLEGKKTTCKFKPIKEAKINAKGIIQIPDKILQTLQTSKGKLVMVKPIIE